MLVIVWGIVIDAKLSHIEKAAIPMLATEFPIVILVKLGLIWKASSPIEVTLYSISSCVTLLGIVTSPE